VFYVFWFIWRQLAEETEAWTDTFCFVSIGCDGYQKQKLACTAAAPGARCAEELQGTHPEHKNKPSEMKPEIVQTQSWRYKAIAFIKRQQKNHHLNKKYRAVT